MKRWYSSGSIREMGERDSGLLPLEIKVSDDDLEGTSITEKSDLEEAVVSTELSGTRLCSAESSEMTTDGPIMAQSKPIVAIVSTHGDVADCERSHCVRLADGSTRTRTRTRTHHSPHPHASNIFWHNRRSCERSRSVRLADGTIRIRTRTRTHRTTTTTQQDKPFWSRETNDTTGMEQMGKIHENNSLAVRFGQVRVREYERIIDSTGIYMGLALGWNWFQETVQPVKDEDISDSKTKRQASGSEAPSKDENTKMKRTNGNERYGMLVRYGYGSRELKQATKEAHAFYKQRQREAARPLVVAEHRKKQNSQADRPVLRSAFG